MATFYAPEKAQSPELIIKDVTGEYRIGPNSDCFVIAEIGHNHQGSLETCKELFMAAKMAGAHAVKLQKRDNKALFTKSFYDSPYNSENAYGPTYGTHREALEFGATEYKALQSFAKELGMVFFSTAFDQPSADFLAELNIPCYKMASGDLTNIPLLKYVAGLGKPMIISTGASTMEDVQRAYDAIMPINQQLAILQCTAAYPAQPGELNLAVIETYRKAFPDIVIGLSDHFNGIAMAPAAYVLGARIVEKHFTLNRAMKGTDHAFSLEPIGLQKMVRDLQRVREALGDGVKAMIEKEVVPRQKMGKQIVAAKNLPAGHVLSPGDLTFKSPAAGLLPYNVDQLYGKALLAEIEEDEALSFDHVGLKQPVASA